MILEETPSIPLWSSSKLWRRWRRSPGSVFPVCPVALGRDLTRETHVPSSNLDGADHFGPFHGSNRRRESKRMITLDPNHFGFQRAGRPERRTDSKWREESFQSRPQWWWAGWEDTKPGPTSMVVSWTLRSPDRSRNFLWKVSTSIQTHDISKSLKNSDVIYWKLYSRKLIPQTFQTAKFTQPQTFTRKASNCHSRFETLRHILSQHSQAANLLYCWIDRDDVFSCASNWGTPAKTTRPTAPKKQQTNKSTRCSHKGETVKL